MAGKKNNGVVAVISDLTNEQAAQLTKEIIKAKRKVAPISICDRNAGTGSYPDKVVSESVNVKYID